MKPSKGLSICEQICWLLRFFASPRRPSGRPRTNRPQPEADPQLARQISRLVSQLNDDRAAERDAAEKKLLELAGTSAAAGRSLPASAAEGNGTNAARGARAARAHPPAGRRSCGEGGDCGHDDHARREGHAAGRCARGDRKANRQQVHRQSRAARRTSQTPKTLASTSN